LRKNWAVDKTWHPQMDAQQRQKGLAGWRKAVTRTLDWVE